MRFLTTPQTWHIAMPAEEPSTASKAVVIVHFGIKPFPLREEDLPDTAMTTISESIPGNVTCLGRHIQLEATIPATGSMPTEFSASIIRLSVYRLSSTK
jgi:hypothetical protein